MRVLWQRPELISSFAGLTLEAPPAHMFATQSLIALTDIDGVRSVLKVSVPSSVPSLEAIRREIAVSEMLAEHAALLPISVAGESVLRSPLDGEGQIVAYIARPHFGDRLLHRLAGGQVRDTRVLGKLFRAASAGLRHLQKCKVVHGDFSAINIVADDTDSVRIIDFGSAHVLSADTEPRRIQRGLREHEPPDAVWSTSFDLFGLGQVLFMAICEGSYFEWIFGGRRELKFRDYVGCMASEMATILRGLSARDFEERYTAHDALDRLLEHL